MKTIKLLILILVFTVFVFHANSQVHPDDRAALEMLYNSTGGPNWRSSTDRDFDNDWNFNEPVNGDWYGVTISGNRVTRLELEGNQLIGTIPTELGNLTLLRRLRLSRNNLSGTIPSSLGNLSQLTLLGLFSNDLEGDVPETFRQLTQLNNLRLNDNRLTGLPDLSALPLNRFYVEENFFDFGDLVPNASKLTNMRSGYSPQKGSVREGEVHDPYIGDDLMLSVEVGDGDPDDGVDNNMYQWKKDGLDLPEPPSATTNTLMLTNIQVLDAGEYYCEIRNNALPLLTLQSSPDIINNVQTFRRQDSLALVALYTSTGGLGGGWINDGWRLDNPIHTWRGVTLDGEERVSSLILTNRGLENDIPPEIGDLANLHTLNLSSNRIRSIPSEIEELSNLITLDLSFNNITGIPSIPSEVGKLNNLVTLDLSRNEISGAVPEEFLGLTNIETLDLSYNMLTDLPDLSELSPSTFNVNNNKLDFGDLEPNRGILTAFIPQALVRDGMEYIRNLGGTLTLSVEVGGNDNIYKWFDVASSIPLSDGTTSSGTMISGATTNTFTLTNIQEADAGKYHCRITNNNPRLQFLELRSSDDILMIINQNPTGIALSKTTINESLNAGSLVGILSTTDPNDPDGEDAYTYSLSGTDASSFQIVGNELRSAEVFDYDIKNSYTITIQTEDAGGLTYQEDFPITITNLILQPVELVSFTASLSENNEVLITWKTATELNSLQFDLEHSHDGINFRKIQEISAKGNSVSLQEYNTIHQYPIFGINYYRIKQIDLDDSFSYFPVISIKIEGEEKRLNAVVYPNPSKEYIYLSVKGLELGEEFEWRLINNFGSILLEGYGLGSDLYHLQLSDIPMGLYILEISSAKESKYFQLLIGN